jgi:hypothetical protein
MTDKTDEIRERLEKAYKWSKVTGYNPSDYFDCLTDLSYLLEENRRLRGALENQGITQNAIIADLRAQMEEVNTLIPNALRRAERAENKAVELNIALGAAMNYVDSHGDEKSRAVCRAALNRSNP